jgi:hypothetical protein
MACAQFLASIFQPSQTSFHTVSASLDRPMKAPIQLMFGHLVTPFLANGIMPAGAYGKAKRSLHREIASYIAATDAMNAILAVPPPPIASVEASLPCPYRTALSQLCLVY